MLTVLGGLAEFERELIRARTGEGRKRAQERGACPHKAPQSRELLGSNCLYFPA
jgi:DNA invertase Pin-like site-specific DNA recombinase